MTSVDKASRTPAIAEEHACQLHSMMDHARDASAPVRCEAALPEGKVNGDLTHQASSDTLNGNLGYWIEDQAGIHFESVATLTIYRDMTVEYTPDSSVPQSTANTYVFPTICVGNVLSGQLPGRGATVQFSLREGAVGSGAHSPSGGGGAGAS